MPDEKRSVTFKFEHGEMIFSIDAVFSLDTPMPQLRKILKFMHKNAWRSTNENFLDLIGCRVNDLANRYKKCWDDASIKYQEEYIIPDSDHVVNGATVPYAKKEVKQIKQHNWYLISRVKESKNKYECFLKRKDIWEQIHEKA